MLPQFLMAFVLFCVPQAGDELIKLPAWISLPAEANLFVVETEKFSTHFAATESLLPAVRSGMLEWAEKNMGADCRPIIESMKLEEFRQFIHKDPTTDEVQEAVHRDRRIYNEEEAKRFEAKFDDSYRGYVRVNVGEKFREHVGKELRVIRLRNRLCGTLVFALLLLGSLGILWSWFFMKRVTRGLYVSRIRWIVGALIALLLVVCYCVCAMLF